MTLKTVAFAPIPKACALKAAMFTDVRRKSLVSPQGRSYHQLAQPVLKVDTLNSAVQAQCVTTQISTQLLDRLAWHGEPVSSSR